MAITLSPSDRSSLITLSGGNLTATLGTSSNNHLVRATISLSGRSYWEITCVSTGIYDGVGVSSSASAVDNNLPGYSDSHGASWTAGGVLYRTTDGAGYTVPSYATGDILSICWDSSAAQIWVRKNGGSWYPGDPSTVAGFSIYTTEAMFETLAPELTGSKYTINLAGPGAYAAPTTFTFPDGPVAAIVYARFWRLNTTASQYGTYPCVAQLDMAYTPGGTTVCAGGTPVSSAYIGGSAYGPAAAFDSNVGTWWNGASAMPGWIGYDFGAGGDRAIEEFRVQARADSPTGATTTFSSATVDYSADGLAWTTLLTLSSPSTWAQGEKRTFTLQISGGLRPVATPTAPVRVDWRRHQRDDERRWRRPPGSQTPMLRAAVAPVPRRAESRWVQSRRSEAWRWARGTQPRAASLPTPRPPGSSALPQSVSRRVFVRSESWRWARPRRTAPPAQQTTSTAQTFVCVVT